MKVTADNITDEQIRELFPVLRAESAALKVEEIGVIEWQRRHAVVTAAHYSARVALGEKRAHRGDSRAKARARCAEILNARTEAK
jgi:nucleotidyltransferase/DNA polymerase involved in DNA repair